MPKIINLEDEFNSWFNEIEAFSLRSERFYEEINHYRTRESQYELIITWLKAAYMHGVRTAAQDSVKTLVEYSTAVEGVDSHCKDYTMSGAFEAAAENLDAYWTDVLKDKE